jgi:hypothetical protein
VDGFAPIGAGNGGDRHIFYYSGLSRCAPGVIFPFFINETDMDGNCLLHALIQAMSHAPGVRGSHNHLLCPPPSPPGSRASHGRTRSNARCLCVQCTQM